MASSSKSQVSIHGGSVPREHWSNMSDTTTIPICDCPIVNVRRAEEDEKKNDDQVDGWVLCPIAHGARDEYIFSEQVYDHLSEYCHGVRPPCRYGQDCRSLVRLEKNVCHRWDDLCHLTIFQHPPRRGKIMDVIEGFNPMSMQEDERSYSCDKKTERIHPLMNDDWNDQLSDHLSFLLIEVIDNGFGMDLVIEKPSDESGMQEKQRQLMEFGQTLKMKLNEMETEEELLEYLREYPIPHRLLNDIDLSLITILQIVDKKLKHKRHLNIPDEMGFRDKWHKRLNHGEMLSLILYSGCDCNYDLCKVMRNDDQKRILDETISLKWKIFEWCLFRGIYKLDDNDNLYSKSVPVYSGIGKVLLNRDLIETVNSSEDGVQFSSFISTSRSISVAKQFRGENGGMIFRIQPRLQRRLICCDISWISKFPDEQEVLVSFFSFGTRWKLSDVSTFLTRDENGQETQVQFFDLVRGR